MKSRFLGAIALSLALTATARAVLTTNSWTNSVSGKWETAGNWSAGAPTNSNAANFITNATTKTVTIDATTTNAANFSTLTISNLTVLGFGAGINTLQLTDAGTNTPLRLNGLGVHSNAVLVVTNSALRVDGSFFVNGSVTNLAGGQIVVTNSIITIGTTSPSRGDFTTSGSLLSVGALVGDAPSSQGTLTIAGGTNTFTGGFTIGNSGNATGVVWVTGESLVVNSNLFIGEFGVGQMTVSNGTVLNSGESFVGRNTGGRGTLTIAGGTIATVDLQVGKGAASSRGTVWMTGGRLLLTNSSTSLLLLGENGTGEMIESNGSVLAWTAVVGSQALGRGTLTVAGGTNTVIGTFTIGNVANATGAAWVKGGQLTVTNDVTYVGKLGVGQMTVSNGTWLAWNVSLGAGSLSQGKLTVAGGTNTLLGTLTVGSVANATGTVWVTGGQLTVTNAITRIGSSGVGQMTVSNATVLSSNVTVGAFSGSQGTWTIACGSNTLSDQLSIGDGANSTGAVWVTGGRLVVTNYFLTAIGNSGVGQMTVSNGTYLAGSVWAGAGAGSRGTLTVAGGTNTLSIQLLVGFHTNSTGTVWVTGGRLVSTNAIYSMFIGESGIGQMTVSNGTCLASDIFVANSAGSQGKLTAAGGTSSVLSSLTIGNFACSATGIVNIVGGDLDVTNAFANGLLEVRSGTLTLSSGTLRVDQFVMTNACGFFTRTGGTLVYGSAVLTTNRDDDADGISNGYEQSHGLDPLNSADASLDNDGDGLTNLQEFQAGTDATNSASVFRITAIAKESNDIRVTWTMGSGKTNALERTAGAAGSFSNNFAAIFTVTNTVGTTTNYLDVGAATNFPSMYYRVRVVP